MTEWHVYLLRCADGSFYAGVATNVERRLKQHNGLLAGGARYTRSRRPVVLAWVESCASRATAQSREASVKRMSRAAKLELASGADAAAGVMASPASVE